MNIGILCASDAELKPFLPMMEGTETVQKAMLTFYTGKISGQDVTALYSGACKVNAALAAQILIDSFRCGTVINAGTAGAMDDRLKVFDTVVSTEAAYHDVGRDILTEFHPWLPSIWFAASKDMLQASKDVVGAGERVFWGRMVTGEAFINDEKRSVVKARFAPLSVDMETGAVAHVCYVNRIPFIAVRTITDSADRDSHDDFERNCARASQISADFVRRFLPAIGKTVI